MHGLTYSVVSLVCVSLSVCWSLGSTRLSPAKTAEPIEMPFGGGQIRVGPVSHILGGITYGRYLANTTDGDDAGCRYYWAHSMGP